MNRFLVRLAAALLLWTTPALPALGAEALPHYNLTVAIDPASHTIDAEAAITLPAGFARQFTLALHRGLRPASATPGVILAPTENATGAVPLEMYQVRLPADIDRFTLRYGGEIFHPVAPYGKEYARGFRDTPGLISPEGVFLSAVSAWYPQLPVERFAFRLRVTMPEGWSAVSQGAMTPGADKTGMAVIWEEETPQEEIYLIGGRFTFYRQQHDNITAMAYLRQPDPQLAQKYLEATGQYLALYESLIGPYPYRKFALVENFWETGFGMPSFTLLGPKVIRFPFILHSSYPHEILHNWWGNGVYVDYNKGNWAEGLTAYLADHLIKEQQGQGVEHRRTVLQKYADYAADRRDFPLTAFTSRHSSATEAVGYGKTLMLFHMLRQRLGDRFFVAGLKDFFQANRFRTATFAEVETSFARVSGQQLSAFFQQWVARTGAPRLSVMNATITEEQGKFRLDATLMQNQEGEAYQLEVPVAVSLAEKATAHETTVAMTGREQTFSLLLDARPQRLDIDPQFDLFRILDQQEIPPALSRVFGAHRLLIVLPAADAGLLPAYRDLAEALRHTGPETVEIISDSEIKNLPDDGAVILLGWGNRFLPLAERGLAPYQGVIAKQTVRFDGHELPRANQSVVAAFRHPDNPTQPLAWIATDVAAAVSGLGRKLPHYHKYSYLGFSGDEPANNAKGIWPVLNSPLTVFFGQDQVTMAATKARQPLAQLPPAFSKTRMLQTIRHLVDESLGGRGFGSSGLEQAAEYLAQEFSRIGLRPAGATKGSYLQEWREKGGSPVKTATLKNVVGVIPGSDPQLAGQSIVIGAHYDHLGRGWPGARQEDRGKIHFGADDNASGVAVLLELARLLVKSPPLKRSLVFVAFSGEEMGKAGSRHYVAHAKRFPASHCFAMLNFDTVGRLGSNKLLVLGGDSAREWVHIFRGAGFVTNVGIELVREELDSSDQASFNAAGIPAVQLFSGPHLDYHRPTDTLKAIDADGLVKVAAVAKEVIQYLGERGEPLTGPAQKTATPASDHAGGRQVSLGTVPDFAYSGKGYRLSGVAPDSPAAAGGLQAGDVIIRLDEMEIASLKDVSILLKTKHAGDSLRITYERQGIPHIITVELAGR